MNIQSLKVQFQIEFRIRVSINKMVNRGSYEKTAILERTVSLPCYLKPKDPDDFVTLVLWYKGYTDVPLYSYDSRAEMTDAVPQHHIGEHLGTRGFFNVDVEPASLEIKDVQENDEGIYRCRVDFLHSRTLTYKVTLNVIDDIKDDITDDITKDIKDDIKDDIKMILQMSAN
ncbi:hypothetical protein GQR58_009469 [Nymphon striatum]|nr:hypothetical protein GQR58_009469 [Nymphon striatum]